MRPEPGAWHVSSWGDSGAPPICWLHGFTWDGGAWAEAAQNLEDRAWSLAPDLPGHGLSPAEPGMGFTSVIAQLAGVLERARRGAYTVVGYSMGGRIALGLALAYPELVDRLVLVGASPGLPSEAERAARRASDAVLAERLETQGMADFLDFWEALPLFSGMRALPEPTRRALRARRERQDPRALALSLGIMGLGAQPDYRDALCALPMPVDLVVGEHDDKFRAIAADMEARLPCATLTQVPASGHAVPFERPEALLDLVSRRLNEPRGPKRSFR